MPESLQQNLKMQESLHNSDIESYLKENGEILIAPTGFSMWPLLKGDFCQVILKQVIEPPEPYDVVLYRTTTGKLILHRVLEQQPDGYRIRGDNTYRDETGIMLTQILGVMSGFYRGDRFVSCESFVYRLYSRIWTWIYPARRFLITLIRLLRRGKK